MKNISELIKSKNVFLVDVRNPWGYDEEHIRNAVNIPLHEIPARTDELKKMDGPVVIYCRSGNRSGVAVNLLKQAGLKNVYNGGGVFNMQKLFPN